MKINVIVFFFWKSRSWDNTVIRQVENILQESKI